VRGVGAAIVQALGWDVVVLAPAATCGESGSGGSGEAAPALRMPRAVAAALEGLARAAALADVAVELARATREVAAAGEGEFAAALAGASAWVAAVEALAWWPPSGGAAGAGEVRRPSAAAAGAAGGRNTTRAAAAAAALLPAPFSAEYTPHCFPDAPYVKDVALAVHFNSAGGWTPAVVTRLHAFYGRAFPLVLFFADLTWAARQGWGVAARRITDCPHNTLWDAFAAGSHNGYQGHLCMVQALVAARGHAVGLVVANDDAVVNWWQFLRRRDLSQPVYRAHRLFSPWDTGKCPPGGAVRSNQQWLCDDRWGVHGLARLVAAGVITPGEAREGRAAAAAAAEPRAASRQPGGGDAAGPYPFMHGAIDVTFVPARLGGRLANLLAAALAEGSHVEMATPSLLAMLSPSHALSPAVCTYLVQRHRDKFSTHWLPELEWFHPLKLAEQRQQAFFDDTVARHGWETPPADLDAPAVREKLRAFSVEGTGRGGQGC